MAIIMFALSFIVCEIIGYHEKYQKREFENEGQGQGVEERELCHSTKKIRFHTGIFSEF